MDAIARIPGVSGVTAAAAAPTNYDASTQQYQRLREADPVSLQLAPIDFNYFDFYHVKAVAGRLPSRDRRHRPVCVQRRSAASRVFVNEAARARRWDFPRPPARCERTTESTLRPWCRAAREHHDRRGGSRLPGRIGAHAGSARDLCRGSRSCLRLVSIRLTGRQIPETVAAIDAVWRKLGEPRAVSRLFLDHYYHRMYIDVIQQRACSASLCGVADFPVGPRAVRALHLHRAAPHQGDRYPQGDGRRHRRRHAPAAVGIQQTGVLGEPDRVARRRHGS